PPTAPAHAAAQPVAPERESRRAEPYKPDQPYKPERTDKAETAEVVPSALDCGPPRPLYPGEHPGPRVVIENVQVNTFGADATVEVKLAVGDRTASGVATGPAVDGYLLRLCAMATAGAVDELLSASDHPEGPARCFVEHAAAVPFGAAQVAVVVLLLSCGGWVEQLAGSAVVTSDDRHAMVRATLAAVNRRLEALLTR
ncbi:Daple, partial [Paractinoplanes deccanensis]